MTIKTVGWTALAAVVTFGAGWIVGASGRSAAVQERGVIEQRALLAETRGLILEGRVSLFLVNFGDASRRFEEARARVETLQTRRREVGLAEQAGRLEIVLAHLRDAQRLAASLDQAAQTAATQALTAFDSSER